MERYCRYDNFAWLYNQEWRAFGERIFPLLKDIIGETLPDRAKVLDLCCGTGQLAKVLTDKGYQVTGIDGSREMLRYAKENAPAAEFTVADARSFKFPPTYNAVFSTFNSLNHILKLEELLRTFKNVRKCLVSGGIFIFDLSTESHFKKHWKNHKEIKETLDCFYAIHNDYNPEERLALFHCTIFRHKTGNWQRSDITVEETFYPAAEVKSSLKKAGFSDIRAYSFSREHGLQQPTRNSFQIFYYARKP
jgi:SAM-dependent methyltransferase